MPILTSSDGRKEQVIIGGLVVDDTKAPSSSPGVLEAVLSGLANMVKAVTGEAKWLAAPAASIKELWGKFHGTTGHEHTGADGDGPVIDAINGPLTVQGQVTCQGVKLAAGTQETGVCGMRGYAPGAGADLMVDINFKTVMTNVPSSITLAGHSILNASALAANLISQYGFRFVVTAAASGMAGASGGTYTTVGN